MARGFEGCDGGVESSRPRIKGPTCFVEEKEEPRPLVVAGKIMNVIFLWLTCLSGCMVMFILESLWSQRYKMMLIIRHDKYPG